MRGEFIAVWSETWREVWLPLIEAPLEGRDEVIAEDIFCELYRVLAGDPKKPGALKHTPSVESVSDILDDPMRSRAAFETIAAHQLSGEPGLIQFFERVHDALDEFGGDQLSNRYFNLLDGFIAKYSLRYDLRRPCTLCPTLPGIVTNVLSSVRAAAGVDAHLTKLQKELDEAIWDLRAGRTESRIKTVLLRQFVLVEGLANGQSGNSGRTLGECCNSASWPHRALRSAAGNIYGFRSNYPSLGHAGNPSAAARDLDDRELVGVSCMLLGIVPYIAPIVDLNRLYGSPVRLHDHSSVLEDRQTTTKRPLFKRIGEYLRSFMRGRPH